MVAWYGRPWLKLRWSANNCNCRQPRVSAILLYILQRFHIDLVIMPKQTNCWISLGLNARSPNVKKAACFLTQVITSQGGMMEPNPPPLVDTTAEDWPPSRSVLFRFIGGESSNKNQADELWLRVIGEDSISFGSPGYLWEPFISSATIPIWLSRIYAWSHGPRVWTLNLPWKMRANPKQNATRI